MYALLLLPRRNADEILLNPFQGFVFDDEFTTVRRNVENAVRQEVPSACTRVVALYCVRAHLAVIIWCTVQLGFIRRLTRVLGYGWHPPRDLSSLVLLT